MNIRSVIYRILAALFAGVMMLLAGTSAGGGGGWTARRPEECVMTFTVLSDVHVEGNNLARYQVFTRSLRDAARNKESKAVVFLGDNTMNGQTGEHLLFHGAVAKLLPEDQNVLVCLGNHDIGNGEGDYEQLQNRWYAFQEAFFGRKLTHPYYSEVIGGCYFIALAMEEHEEFYVSPAQYDWLAGVLAEAAESGMPAFVFSHYPTHYARGKNANGERLTDVLAAYAEAYDLISFVGHTHMPMHGYWSFDEDDGYPEIYLPRLTDLRGENDNEPYSDTGVGVQVEIYRNEVSVRARDFYRGQWKLDQWEDDLPLLERTYELKNPIEP